MKLIFASNNKGKIIEVQSLIPDTIQIVAMKDAGIDADIPEPFFTFEENAHAKAIYIKEATGINCFAEDSGLIVPALQGEPGVFSARYAGVPSNDEANNDKLIQSLSGITDRSAYYQSTICLILNEEVHYFEGKCYGTIADQRQGTGGFGYDPLFIPDGYEQTFGQIPLEVKNTLSHRGKAMALFSYFLNKYTED